VKFAGTSDWRDAIAFDTPMIVAELVPGDPARCSACGGLRPRTELWALKQRHPHHHDGYVRFYCSEHLPKVEQREPPAEMRRRSTPRAERAPAARRSVPAAQKQRAMCPNCFIEVSAAGVCGVCGWPDS
jgi:hypothetical protein